jgi:hypothetical protein
LVQGESNGNEFFVYSRKCHTTHPPTNPTFLFFLSSLAAKYQTSTKMSASTKQVMDTVYSVLLNILVVVVIVWALVYVIKTIRKRGPSETEILGLRGDGMPRNYVAMSDSRHPQSVTITFVPVDLHEDRGVENDVTNSAAPPGRGRTLGSRSPQAAEAA